MELAWILRLFLEKNVPLVGWVRLFLEKDVPLVGWVSGSVTHRRGYSYFEKSPKGALNRKFALSDSQ